MPVGRHRKVCPSPEECINLGEDFVSWATEETDEFRCLVQQWYSLKQGLLRKEWKRLIDTPQFRPYYEQGIAALSVKAIDGTMKEGFGHRYLRYYDRELAENEDETKAYESSLKKDENKDNSKTYIIQVDNGLASGAKLPSASIPTVDHTCPE